MYPCTARRDLVHRSSCRQPSEGDQVAFFGTLELHPAPPCPGWREGGSSANQGFQKGDLVALRGMEGGSRGRGAGLCPMERELHQEEGACARPALLHRDAARLLRDRGSVAAPAPNGTNRDSARRSSSRPPPCCSQTLPPSNSPPGPRRGPGAWSGPLLRWQHQQ